jgi:hypothetical protein
MAELTLGDASPLLPLAAVGLTRHRLADTDSDVARYHPELILDILQRWRDPVGGRR